MSIKLLKEAIQLIIESPTSDGFEQSVAKSINSQFKSRGITAKRAGGDTTLPDVLVTVTNLGNSFIEVKMSHTDNLANPRVFYDGTKWNSTYKTPVAKYAVELLNSSEQSAEFVRDISDFVGRKTVKLPTTISGLKDPDAVSLKEMFEFASARGGRYVVSEPNIDVGRLVTLHYTIGKSQAAHYLQAKDDFYMIGNADPLGLNIVNGGGIPLLGGTGDFKVRVSTRSKFYEIQTELKIKHFDPVSSRYSVLRGSTKINPFAALADSIVQPEAPPVATKVIKKIKSSTRH